MPIFNKRSSIKCACWNIGGLVSKGMNKLDDKEFIAKISHNDINFLVETHIGPDTKLIHRTSSVTLCVEKYQIMEDTMVA